MAQKLLNSPKVTTATRKPRRERRQLSANNVPLLMPRRAGEIQATVFGFAGQKTVALTVQSGGNAA